MRHAGLPEAVLRDLTPDRLAENADYVVWYSKDKRNAYLVSPYGARLVTVRLRPPRSVSERVAMCSLCCTVHPAGGIGLWTATRRQAVRSVVGQWICREFDCAEYVRPGGIFPTLSQMPETITADQRGRRLRMNLARFIETILGAPMNS